MIVQINFIILEQKVVRSQLISFSFETDQVTNDLYSQGTCDNLWWCFVIIRVKTPCPSHSAHPGAPPRLWGICKKGKTTIDITFIFSHIFLTCQSCLCLLCSEPWALWAEWGRGWRDPPSQNPAMRSSLLWRQIMAGHECLRFFISCL